MAYGYKRKRTYGRRRPTFRRRRYRRRTYRRAPASSALGRARARIRRAIKHRAGGFKSPAATGYLKRAFEYIADGVRKFDVKRFKQDMSRFQNPLGLSHAEMAEIASSMGWNVPQIGPPNPPTEHLIEM